MVLLMKRPQIVLDTNVLVSALLSGRGAANKLLRLVGMDKFDIHVSVPLVLEYEDVLKRRQFQQWWSLEEADNVINYLCSVATSHKIWFLWRPLLTDAKDDFVVELALKAQADYIVTFNVKDFHQALPLGISVMTPNTFLREIGEPL
jgi:putative PIN family toxin of toxin-antitoxin system